MRNSISIKTCVKLSNSVCDLLIVSLQTPSLIIILVYHHPSCPVKDFDEISLKFIRTCYVTSLPLPNIILFCNFNIPEINWSSLNPSYPTAGSLLNLTSLTFLHQQVSEPTWNCNILDLICCPDNIINCITVSHTFLFHHRVIYVVTSLLVNCATELAPVLLLIVSYFPIELSQNLGRKLLLFRFTSLAIKLSQVIIV